MQSIDQQAAASQTSGQPLSRNSRIQTPNSSASCMHAARTHFNMVQACTHPAVVGTESILRSFHNVN